MSEVYKVYNPGPRVETLSFRGPGGHVQNVKVDRYIYYRVIEDECLRTGASKSEYLRELAWNERGKSAQELILKRLKLIALARWTAHVFLLDWQVLFREFPINDENHGNAREHALYIGSDGYFDLWNSDNAISIRRE